MIERGPWINEQKGNGPLTRIKPFTPEVRAEIDNDLTDRAIAFIRQSEKAGKPFFCYLPFSMGHAPNYPSKQFAGKSSIGQYGDKMMEGDYHVGQVMDLLKELNIEDNTIFVFASDNGPWGWDAREFGNLATPDMGSPGPWRGQIGGVTDGSLRTFCFIRWPGHIKPDSKTNAMFSIMDFMPTFASILGTKMPSDRPIDGVDQTDLLTGKNPKGNRESLISFIGPELMAVRWKQFHLYFQDDKMTGTGQQMLGGTYMSVSKMFFPKVCNIEMDPHEDLNMGGIDALLVPMAYREVELYLESLRKYPNPPAPNITNYIGKSN
jgi:arylsulfatase A-like enzyme